MWPRSGSSGKREPRRSEYLRTDRTRERRKSTSTSFARRWNHSTRDAGSAPADGTGSDAPATDSRRVMEDGGRKTEDEGRRTKDGGQSEFRSGEASSVRQSPSVTRTFDRAAGRSLPATG